MGWRLQMSAFDPKWHCYFDRHAMVSPTKLGANRDRLGDFMAEARAERRLAAIFAADVAGYSRLMGVDEEGTLSRFNSHRRELLEPKLAEHRGRIVKRTGDGVLVEFASVVDAARCAVEIQQGMVERNASSPEDKRIEFRIGIYVGDVIFEDGVSVSNLLGSIVIQPLQRPCESRCSLQDYQNNFHRDHSWPVLALSGNP
jgi:hypothetical protein